MSGRPVDAATLKSVLEGVLGPEGCRFDPAAREPFALDGRVPEAVVFPPTPERAAELLRACGGAWGIVPWGGGHRAEIGPPPTRYGVALSLARIAEIGEYDTESLTLSAGAGTTLFDVDQRTRAHNQMLAVGWPWERHTLGGLAAGNRGTPKRLAYGALRDQLLGIKVALADGSLTRFGGKVLKNVAGYDMTKFFLGSRGALGVIVETTWKLFARPDHEVYLWAAMPSVDAAGRLAADLLRSPLLPACVFLLEPKAAQRLAGLERLGDLAGRPLALVGFDGRAAATRRQTADAEALAGKAGGEALPAREEIGQQAAGYLMGELPSEEPALRLRLGTLPSFSGEAFGAVRSALDNHGCTGEAVADYAAGRLTLWADAAESAPEALRSLTETLRKRLAPVDGFVEVERAPPEVKASLSLWGDLGGSAKLNRVFKEKLDPQNALAPGRLPGVPGEF